MDPPPLYRITLRPAAGADWHVRRLAALLKRLGRPYGLRAVRVEEIPGARHRPGPGGEYPGAASG